MERIILHIDVNNAFLSWSAVEMLKNGAQIDIRNIPSIIGGDEKQRRGVVLAKSIKAKECGIKTGEPIYFAKQKCNNLKIYPSNHQLYKQYSDRLYKLFLEYTDKIERFSIDECFLDMTDFLSKNETILEKAKNIKERIKKELGFTVNIGISTNKLLAKMASDFEKPDKIHTLYPNEIEKKMWILPVSELFMVGRKSVPKLNNMGIKTIGDLAKTDMNKLAKAFGKFGKTMWEYANGIDNTEVISQYVQPKCIGNSITLPYDICDINKLNEVLLDLAEQVAYRLRKNNLYCKVINVQIKTKNFKVYSHQKKLNNYINNTKDIYSNAKELLQELHNNEYIRLIGLRVDVLSNKEQEQLSIFDSKQDDKQEKLDKTIDNLKEKYGYNKVTRAGRMNIDKIIHD